MQSADRRHEPMVEHPDGAKGGHTESGLAALIVHGPSRRQPAALPGIKVVDQSFRSFGLDELTV